MKKLYLFFSLLVLAAGARSQDTWGPPFPLTDLLTNNVNATLSVIPADFIQPDTVFMLWERSSDTLSTAIYALNLTTMGYPFMVAGQANVHFKHPRVFRRGSGDTLFYFSYETDMNGNWDLYYSILLRNETTLGPYPFIRSGSNERSLNYGDPQTFSWEKEGYIYAKNSITDTIQLAGDSCSHPVELIQGFVAYEMTLGPETGVFFSTYDFFTHLWTGPFPVDIYGTNTHPTFGNDSHGAFYSPYLFWQHNEGTNWAIKGFDLVGLEYCSFNNFAGYNNISPTFCTVEMTTDHTVNPLLPFSSFASDVSGNMEIYVNQIWGDTTYTNISQYSGTDTHPQLFNNFHVSFGGLDNQLFDIWESNRFGHWQLWATTRDILTGEKTLVKPSSLSIRCSPNPFAEEIHIGILAEEPGPVTVDIFDLTGRKITALFPSPVGKGKYSLTWNGKDAAGAPVPAGIYLCKATKGDQVRCCKIAHR
jgi:hypothetical protein